MNDRPTPPFEPDRFRTAAAFYEQGRAHYAPALIARIAEVTGLGAKDRLLDLGCGPAPLARAFAPFAGEVVAMDPNPEMLAYARERSAGLANVRIVAGSSYDLEPALGQFTLAVMGRSFHWMDRQDTLRRLDRMIEPQGAVVLFHDRAPEVPANAWREVWRAIRERYAPDPSPHRARGFARHEAVLLDSAFCRLETFGVIERRALDIETLVARALSMSATSPSHLGDRTETMVDDLRLALHEVSEEVVESQALVAWRAL